MIKLENTEVMGIKGAIRGMRNPLNSWEKSDSFICTGGQCDLCVYDGTKCTADKYMKFIVGINDLSLAKKLINAGTDHRKFMRQIFVSVDITAPLYWWKEYDTYKVGTATNSCSTMHKIHSKPIKIEDFSTEKMTTNTLKIMKKEVIPTLETLRTTYESTKDKCYWYSIIQLLPSSYNQTRTCTMTYENLLNMYYARRNHKLSEWHDFCEWIESLPYMKDFLSKE